MAHLFNEPCGEFALLTAIEALLHFGSTAVELGVTDRIPTLDDVQYALA
jgi:hypothetical protein